MLVDYYVMFLISATKLSLDCFHNLFTHLGEGVYTDSSMLLNIFAKGSSHVFKENERDPNINKG